MRSVRVIREMTASVEKRAEMILEREAAPRLGSIGTYEEKGETT